MCVSRACVRLSHVCVCVCLYGCACLVLVAGALTGVAVQDVGTTSVKGGESVTGWE